MESGEPVSFPQSWFQCHVFPRVVCWYRPLTVSTEDYGTMWLAFSHDTKQNLSLLDDAHDPLTATLNVLKEKLHLHVVEIIGEHTLVSCSFVCDSLRIQTIFPDYGRGLGTRSLE